MSSGASSESRRRQLQYLEAMGVQAWESRSHDAVAPVIEETPPDAAGAVQRTTPVTDPNTAPPLDWDALQVRVSECTGCELHAGRTQTVFGTGNRQADWLVIGEAPGQDEDLQGEPFVGRAGQLLNAMLQAIGLQRDEVYIANILKCRPPDNRDPKPGEVACCEPWLMRQIELIQPRMILAVGRIAAQNLLQSETPIGKLRGQVHRFRDTGIPLLATYHPAYLLRSPKEKRKAWQDLQLAVRTMREHQS